LLSALTEESGGIFGVLGGHQTFPLTPFLGRKGDKRGKVWVQGGDGFFVLSEHIFLVGHLKASS